MTDRDYRQTVFLPKTDFPMKAGLAALEPRILARWGEQDLYGQLRAARAGRPRFILHDGPPYANGDLHMGHAMNKVLKDVIVRTRSMLGQDAPYVPGWDCHGLPIEWKIEERYRDRKSNATKTDDPFAFRAECRAYAAEWVINQSAQFQRLGVMGDWSAPYRTMDFASEATIVAELLKFAASGQLFRGAKPVMWSPVEQTALAEAEIEYEDIVSTQIDVAFEIVSSPIPALVGAHAVIWTTTPWTIPVNQAIAYGPEINYVVINQTVGQAKFLSPGMPMPLASTRKLIVAEKRLLDLLDRMNDGLGREPQQGLEFFDPARKMVVGRFLGTDLAGSFAKHPMHLRGDFFAKPRPFLPGDFVTTEQGTGLVHMAPDHGEDDFALCKANGLEPAFAVEGDGRYRADWAWLRGQGSVIAPKFNAPDGPICSDLRAAGALLAASADYAHSYPHSWRSKAKLIYRATPQWFIAMDRALPFPLEGEGQVAPSATRERGFSAEEAPLPAAQGGSGPSPSRGEGSLRDLALAAIRDTRWVPARAENRIRAMVEGRPDWLISRQRAWGVPITLFVDRRTGEYLVDPAVNARIVAAVEAGGADAWWATDPAVFLGPERDPDDWERVGDILDVWFDSGSTHAFVVEARYGEGVRADLYVEGSDQHRGWFQSSLLESCGTRGRAPYEAVLTHGFALDAQGKKMSKSIGNTVDPLKVAGDSGADILRLWVVSTDYFEDVRIGKEMLAGQSDVYRKLRNTFRYLLGALDGYTAAEAVAYADMPELERWVLHRLTELDAAVRQAAADFDFGPAMVALNAFANQDLSAFVFDVRKDSLYCDAADAPKRRAYRTVLSAVFDCLATWLAPVLVFTAEEAWGLRWPDRGSVHLAEWPELPGEWRDEALAARWVRLRELRGLVTQNIEPMRREKKLGTSLQAAVTVGSDAASIGLMQGIDFNELCIAGRTEFEQRDSDAVMVDTSDDPRCERCWRHRADVAADTGLCDRCAEVVADV